MRHTEFWVRMDQVLGTAYSRVWSRQQVLAALGGRTVDQALDAGEPPKEVWRAVVAALGLPDNQR